VWRRQPRAQPKALNLLHKFIALECPPKKFGVTMPENTCFLTWVCIRS